MAMLAPGGIGHHIERWVVELLRAEEGHPDYAGTFEQLQGRILPVVLSGTVTDFHAGTMVTQSFVAELLIAYAIDNDRTMAYIPQKHFESWGVSLEEMHQAALANLVGRSESINAQAAQDDDGSINLILFQTMDGYDASRILLPTLHDRLREYLGSPFAAGIPNRDILLCFRNDEETVSRLREQIEEDYRQMPHNVTDKLLLVTADGIAARIDSAAH